MTDVSQQTAALPGQKCSNCNAFYAPATGPTVCRAHPPTRTFHGYSGTDVTPDHVVTFTGFPEVDGEDWCREWQQKT